MAYSATFWVNNSEPAITAEKLNKIEYGVASGHAIAESKASTDYVQGQVAAEVDARINYVDAAVNNLEQQIDDTNSNIVPVVYNEMLDTESSLSAIVDSKSITAVDTNFSLSTLTTNLATEFGENASNITTKLATYAQSEDVGAIAQVALDVNGRITGWTAVDSSVGGSAFRINADTFALADASNEHTPFAIDAATGVAQFNGIVQFSNTDMSAYDNSNVDVPTTEDIVVDINAGNTTTINGDRITTGTVTAEKINTVGLIAENISANEIVGKTITGSVLNGARINGAVIKASYLDLDGELEVLTNFHISVATYNSNPSLYSDAVYIETDNEYRIPSLSTIRENNGTVNSSPNSWLYSLIRAYNVANAGHNNKIVKNIPTITASVDSPVWVFNSNFTESYSYTGESDGVFTPVTSNKTNSFRVYVGDSYSQVITVSHIANPESYSDTGYWYSELLIKYGSTVIYDGYAVNAEANTYTFSLNGLTFRLSYPKVRYDTVVTPSGFYSTTTYYCELDLKVELVAGDHTVSASLGNYLLKGNTPTVQTAGYIKANYMKFPSSILVNNMI